ncbi:hypothetical protein ABVT39_015478 [Epinephelus coioides]
MSEAIKKHWHILVTDPALHGQFNQPLRIVFRRPSNIRNMLVRADCPPDPPPTPSTFLGTPEPGNYKCAVILGRIAAPPPPCSPPAITFKVKDKPEDSFLFSSGSSAPNHLILISSSLPPPPPASRPRGGSLIGYGSITLLIAHHLQGV